MKAKAGLVISASHCVAASCGDGYIRAGVEECGDGNLLNGDCPPPQLCRDGMCI
jgi:cysteine-rich repeat protein